MHEIVEFITARYNLYDEIEDYTAYEEFITNMLNYNSGDRVNIHISSNGGRIDVGGILVNAIQSTQAYVTCIIEQPSCSMAALIALSGDDLIMYPNTYLMFHNYSSYAMGKGKEMTLQVNFEDRHLNQAIKSLSSPFLTAAELKYIEHDGTLYIYSDDNSLPKRIKRHFRRKTCS